MITINEYSAALEKRVQENLGADCVVNSYGDGILLGIDGDIEIEVADDEVRGYITAYSVADSLQNENMVNAVGGPSAALETLKAAGLKAQRIHVISVDYWDDEDDLDAIKNAIICANWHCAVTVFPSGTVAALLGWEA